MYEGEEEKALHWCKVLREKSAALRMHADFLERMAAEVEAMIYDVTKEERE